MRKWCNGLVVKVFPYHEEIKMTTLLISLQVLWNLKKHLLWKTTYDLAFNQNNFIINNSLFSTISYNELWTLAQVYGGKN